MSEATTNEFTTEQEAFWAGQFGNDYVGRNASAGLVASKTARFARVLARTGPCDSVLELGANIGLNVRAIRHLLPEVKVDAVEINDQAVQVLAEIEGCTAHHSSILEWSPPQKYDFVFTSGVLIHINPDALTTVYDLMAEASGRFVMVAEYYNPTPVSIPYRGHDDRLFKRDFAGEFLDRHSDFELVDYAFNYRRGIFPADDTTWFLMERRVS